MHEEFLKKCDQLTDEQILELLTCVDAAIYKRITNLHELILFCGFIFGGLAEIWKFGGGTITATLNHPEIKEPIVYC